MATYDSALLEDINGKIDTILEIVVPMQRDILVIKEDTAKIKSEIREIKSLLKETIKEVALPTV